MTLELKKQIIEDAAVRIESGLIQRSCLAIHVAAWKLGLEKDKRRELLDEYYGFYGQECAEWFEDIPGADLQHLRVMLLLWFRESLGDET